MSALDRGELRVASPPATEGGAWTTNTWIKEAILLYFAVRKMEKHEVGPFEFQDKIPLKRDLDAGVRVVPPAVPPTAAAAQRVARQVGATLRLADRGASLRVPRSPARDRA